MKKMKLAFAAIAATMTFGASGAAQAETLRVGMECTYPPFNYRSEDGDLAGYDVDVAKGVAEIMGVELEYVCQEWGGMIPALLANKFDLIIASMSITETRLEKMDFSRPYRDSIGRMIGRKGLNKELFDADGNPIAANFDGLRVGLERASTYEAWFNAKVPDADVVYYDGTEPMYLDLINGRVDAIMSNPMKIHLKFLSQERGKDYEFISPSLNEEEFFGIGVGIGLRQGQPELKARLDSALDQLIAEDKLTEYALKYFPFAIYNEN
ncbi:transporter substrate-binding domain-containing protein [Aliiroseovarius sp.]|uniref:transporter substrate-binding domain-containing protein n=1 Tax=Aliiroseovarius sp. TaxID=1872442 RepID=UPI003BABEEA9